jgi:hypothetical protein
MNVIGPSILHFLFDDFFCFLFNSSVSHVSFLFYIFSFKKMCILGLSNEKWSLLAILLFLQHKKVL